MFLVVRARFLAGYAGREWPPSPARLFKALVAVSRHGVPGAGRDDVDSALRWLERQNAPTVLASRTEPTSSSLRRFVPNNSEIDPKTGEREWPATRASKEPEDIRGWRIDPPGGVAYAWPVADGGRNMDLLRAVARRVPSLGKGEDFVVARAERVDELPGDLVRYDPAAEGSGFTLEVPQEGCLSVCEEMFKRRAADPGWNRIHELRTMGTRLEAYAAHVERLDHPSPPIAVFGIWAGPRRRSFDARLLRVPVGQCRHLLSTALSEAVSDMSSEPGRRDELLRLGQGLICGHSPTGGKLGGPHVAVLALPSVLGPYPDGRVRRLALVGFGCADATAAQLFEAVVARVHDREFVDEDRRTGVVLRRETDAEWMSLLSGRARDWESVTPVVLERPEFLRKDWERLGHATRRRDARAGDTRAAGELDHCLAARREELVRDAVGRLGVGEAVNIEVTRAPWRTGLHSASQYRVSGRLKASPRFHVRVSFKAFVSGPVVVGRGRYIGFGLLRPRP